MDLGNFGSYLFKQGLVGLDDLKIALRHQQRYPFLRIGEILVKIGALDFDRLAAALVNYRKQLRIGELLLLEGVITRFQLEEALVIQEERGKMLGQILVDQGWCESRHVASALEAKAQPPYEPFGLSPNASFGE